MSRKIKAVTLKAAGNQTNFIISALTSTEGVAAICSI